MAPNKLAAILAVFIGALAYAEGVSASDTLLNTKGLHQALESLRKSDFSLAEQQARELALQGNVAAPRSWLVVAAARTQQGRYASAVRAYRTYLATCPSGESRRFVLDQIDECTQAMKAPSPVKTPSQKLSEDVLAALSSISDQTATESSEHFVVHSRNAKLSRLLVVQCESSLKGICQNILGGADFPHSVNVYVWTDSKEYLSHAQNAPDWSGGNFSISSAGGIVTRRIDLTQLDKDGKLATVMIDRILPHELCHVVSREYFGDAPCPLFLDEGLAMMSESSIDGDRMVLAGSVLAGKQKISLDGLFTRNRDSMESVDAFYAESLSFTEFLRGKLSERQFKDFLENVKSGCTVGDAIQRALYVSQDDEAFIPQLSVAWEDHAIRQGQVIRALRGDGSSDLSRNN